jgi:hypothetical protein
MSRNKLNFVLDLTSFCDLLGLIFTGYIIKYTLPPGTGGNGHILHGSGQNVHLKELWLMTRHEWGEIHFYLAVTFMVLMVCHIILHWNWIKHNMK